MHASARRFIEDCIRSSPPTGRVLEVGARDVNGSIRDLFGPAVSYVGVDLLEGKGVDVVANAHALPFPDRTFDLTISTSQLEHDYDPWATAEEMVRVLRPGGRLLVIVPGFGWPRHNEPDYWRFSAEALERLFTRTGYSLHITISAETGESGPDVRLWGQKAG